MRLLYGFFCILFYTQIVHTTEYMYPVACLDDTTLLYIHQTAPDTIQLFEYNTITHHSEQTLWSLFNPAGIQLLPDNKGFSFIDNGRLRVKAFQKRAPKAIDFDEPLFNISAISWINDDMGYFSAYYNNHFSLFEFDTNGRVDRLISSKSDCMYPQKINDQLFYIERTKNGLDYTYAIKKTLYKQECLAQLILDFHADPVIFLHMISETEGFVIEHEKDTDTESSCACFIYHHLQQEGATWQSRSLFSFSIPTDLFLNNNDHRLFESILPLLPRLINNKIYFVDYSSSRHNLEPYYYDISTQERHKITIEKQKGHLFVPIQVGSRLCFGGVHDEKQAPFILF